MSVWLVLVSLDNFLFEFILLLVINKLPNQFINENGDSIHLFSSTKSYQEEMLNNESDGYLTYSLASFLLLLLILSGDIELNPGPETVKY